MKSEPKMCEFEWSHLLRWDCRGNSPLWCSCRSSQDRSTRRCCPRRLCGWTLSSRLCQTSPVQTDQRVEEKITGRYETTKLRVTIIELCYINDHFKEGTSKIFLENIIQKIEGQRDNFLVCQLLLSEVSKFFYNLLRNILSEHDVH